MSLRPPFGVIEVHPKPITYNEALSKISELVASAPSSLVPLDHEGHDQCCKRGRDLAKCQQAPLALIDVLGRPCKKEIFAPHSTPQFDTSAMDGYAVCSSTTMAASQQSPVTYRVVDSIAAGDVRKSSPARTKHPFKAGRLCVEIMTGAAFPDTAYPELDAVVKVEDVTTVGSDSLGDGRLPRSIQIKKPVRFQQHRRPAGSDFQKHCTIIREAEIVGPPHIAALASLGFGSVEVVESAIDRVSMAVNEASAKLKVGVISTGSELVSPSKGRGQASTRHTIPDSNGPYIVSSIRHRFPNVVVEYLGVMEDTEENLETVISGAIGGCGYDVVITSGGVSKGRYDLVRDVVERRMGGQVVFHGVKVRPGAPILCATLQDKTQHQEKEGRDKRRITFFGAPGNPVAAAASLRFFIYPYIESFLKLRGSSFGVGNKPPLAHDETEFETETVMLEQGRLRCKPEDTTTFWLARKDPATGVVEILSDQASYKVSGMLRANGWVIVPAEWKEVRNGDCLVWCSL